MELDEHRISAIQEWPDLGRPDLSGGLQDLPGSYRQYTRFQPQFDWRPSPLLHPLELRTHTWNAGIRRNEAGLPILHGDDFCSEPCAEFDDRAEPCPGEPYREWHRNRLHLFHQQQL